MRSWKLFYWILIVFVALFSRFYRLNEYPPSLTIDEVSIGYNSYSILNTGRDEWGQYLPTSFKSVGDYKSPTLIYLTVPFIKLFGLNEWSVRLPVALFSCLSIYLFWLLVSKYIFSKDQYQLAYLSTFIFTLSPWLIVYSRSGFEAVLAQTFMLINLIFGFKYLKSGLISDFIGMFIFAVVSAITYHSTKIVVPIINLLFIVYNFDYFVSTVKKWYGDNKPVFILSIFIFMSLVIFFIKNYILGNGSSRAQMTFLIKDFDYAKTLLPTFASHNFGTLTSTIGLLSFWYKRLLEYFSANFYLSNGLGLATSGHPAQGVIYAIEYPIMILGLIVFLKNGSYLNLQYKNNFLPKILTIWAFASLLPASITNNSQHSLRTLNILPVVCIFISIGFASIWKSCKNHKVLQSIFIGTLFLGYVYGVARFTDYYFLHYPMELSETRSYGWKQVAEYGWKHHLEYDTIYVDPRFGTEGPYTYGVPNMYFLFYSHYNPRTYFSGRQKFIGTNFENFVFGEINWPNIDHTKNNLYIASPWSFPSQLLGSDKQKFFISFLNGKSGLYAVSDK